MIWLLVCWVAGIWVVILGFIENDEWFGNVVEIFGCIIEGDGVMDLQKVGNKEGVCLSTLIPGHMIFLKFSEMNRGTEKQG